MLKRLMFAAVLAVLGVLVAPVTAKNTPQSANESCNAWGCQCIYEFVWVDGDYDVFEDCG